MGEVSFCQRRFSWTASGVVGQGRLSYMFIGHSFWESEYHFRVPSYQKVWIFTQIPIKSYVKSWEDCCICQIVHNLRLGSEPESPVSRPFLYWLPAQPCTCRQRKIQENANVQQNYTCTNNERKHTNRILPWQAGMADDREGIYRAHTVRAGNGQWRRWKHNVGKEGLSTFTSNNLKPESTSIRDRLKSEST